MNKAIVAWVMLFFCNLIWSFHASERSASCMDACRIHFASMTGWGLVQPNSFSGKIPVRVNSPSNEANGRQ